MTARWPNRSTRCGATRDIGITISAIGSRHERAVQRAVAEDQQQELEPDEEEPEQAQELHRDASVPVLKPRSANSRTSSIGRRSHASSQRTNATSAAAATVRPTRALVLVHPASAPSMIP